MIASLKHPLRQIVVALRTISLTGLCILGLKQSSNADPKVDSLLLLAETTTNDSLKVHAWNAAAYHYLFSDAGKTLELLKKAEPVAKKSGNEFVYGQVLNTMGNYFGISGQQDSAFFYLNQALALGEKHNLGKIQTISLNNLGLTYWRSGMFDQALSHFFGALRLLEKEANPNQEAMAKYLSNIGLIHQELSQFDEAIDYHKRALKLRTDLGIPHEMCISQANLGVCYKKKGEYSEAERYYLAAIDQAAISENMMMYYSLHDNLGVLRIEENKLDEAIIALLTAYNKPANLPANPKSGLSILSNLSKAYLLADRMEEAKQYGTLAVGLLQAHPELEPYGQTLCFAMAELCFRTKNHEEARSWAARYQQITEGNFSAQNAKELAAQKTKFETEKKEQTIRLQEAKIEEHKALNQRNLLLLLLTGLACAGILLTAYVLIKNKNKKLLIAQQQQELLIRQQQLQVNIITQENERKRFAKDLHDNFGQLITGLQLTLQQLHDRESPGDRAEVYVQAGSLIDNMHEEIRRTAFNLMPATLEQSGLPAALEELALRVNQNRNVIVTATQFGFEERLQEMQEIHLYRITQEWVNNVLKYAIPGKVEIQLVRHEDRATLMIEDNGTGFNPEKLSSGKGHGWKNIRSRVQLLNGSVHIDSQPGVNGTTLVVEFPISDKAPIEIGHDLTIPEPEPMS